MASSRIGQEESNLQQVLDDCQEILFIVILIKVFPEKSFFFSMKTFKTELATYLEKR